MQPRGHGPGNTGIDPVLRDHRQASRGIIRRPVLQEPWKSPMSEPDQRLCLYGIKACDTMKRPVPGSTNMGRTTSSTTTRAPGSTAPTWKPGATSMAGRPYSIVPAPPSANWTTLPRPILTRRAIELMLAQPSMIKRPVLDLGDRTLIGFKPDLYAAALAAPN